MKRIRKRRISFVQFFLAIMAVFAIGGFALINTVNNVFAASVSGFLVEGLTATYENGNWTSSTPNSLTGTATGEDGGCGSPSAETSTMTLECKKNNATLSFSYAQPTIGTGGYVKIDGTSVNKAGTFAKQMNSGDEITIEILSGDAGAKSSSISITDITLVSVATISATFMDPNPVAGGTYTINGTDYSEFSPNPYTYTTGGTTTITVRATPNSGYGFACWLNGDGTLYSTKIEIEILKDVDYSIYPYFYNFNDGLFFIDKDAVYKNNFEEAVAYANSKGNCVISVETQNAYVPAGEYTVNSGVTLLVPYEASRKNCSADKPETTSDRTPINTSTSASPFRTLTLTNGASLNIQGNLCVNGFTNSNNTGYTGCTYGKYGYLYLYDGSSITVKSGGKIYCWGYISGGGTITAKSGAKIYEPFQIADARGGSRTNTLVNANTVFPFTQYYVQNIESKLIIEYGAESYATGSVNIIGASQPVIKFIGSSTGFLLKMESGCTVSKQYDPLTDRNIFEMSGNASISSISLSISSLIIVDSADYIVPLMENMTFNILSGKTTLSQKICLLPGCVINVAEEATIESSKDVYVYDREDWVGKSYVYGNDTNFVPSYHSPTRANANKFKLANMIDAEINVNGTLKFGSGGKFYTTTSGANIHSSTGNGKIKFDGAAPTSSAITYQCKENKTQEEITVYSAHLLNMDGESYVETQGTLAGEFYNVHKKTGIWTKGYEPTYFDINIVDEDGTTIVYSYENFLSGDDFTFPQVLDTSLSNPSSFIFWTDGTNVYHPNDVLLELSGMEGMTKTFKTFRGGWFGTKYYRYDINNTDPVKGFWTIGDNSIRDYKKLSDDSDPIPYHSTCYFDETTGELDTGGTTFEIGTSTLFMPEKIILNAVDNNYYLILGGILEKNRGLFEHINGSYYYFGDANFAYKDGTYYVDNTNGLTYNNESIQPGYYYFDSYGIMDIEGLHTKPTTIKNGVAYVTYDSEVADNYGLFAYNNNLYYAGTNGVLVTSTSFYVGSDMINGCTIGSTLVTKGLYYFDDNGRMYDSQLNLITNGGQSV